MVGGGRQGGIVTLEHDFDADALYIRLTDGTVARTLEVDSDPCTMVDLDGDGNLIGIEVIDPDRPWPLWKIMKSYDFSDADAAMLMASYPPNARVLR